MNTVFCVLQIWANIFQFNFLIIIYSINYAITIGYGQNYIYIVQQYTYYAKELGTVKHTVS